MKKLVYVLVASSLILMAACGTSKKEQRAEAKRKKDAEKMEQLENNKKQFEQKNKNDLGK